ncbi:MAG: VPLPA-CTERM sorting domain-containing protein [Alkalilacustris sp.]
MIASSVADRPTHRTWAVLCCAVAAGALLTQPGLAATHGVDDPAQLLSEDGFGACVPEENLDRIWLVAAKGGKQSRVPHVCMRGDCDDLPEIDVWASAQQYPDDVDLDRDDVQARYANFVESFCAADPDPVPEVTMTVPEDVVPDVLMEVPAPLLARAMGPVWDLPRFSNSPAPFMPAFAPMGSFGGWGGSGGSGGVPPQVTPPGGTPPWGNPPGQTPPWGDPPGDTPPWADPPGDLPPTPTGEPPLAEDPPETPPLSVVPLPAALWLLVAALAGLGLLRRRALA